MNSKFTYILKRIFLASLISFGVFLYYWNQGSDVRNVKNGDATLVCTFPDEEMMIYPDQIVNFNKTSNSWVFITGMEFDKCKVVEVPYPLPWRHRIGQEEK